MAVVRPSACIVNCVGVVDRTETEHVILKIKYICKDQSLQLLYDKLYMLKKQFELKNS